MSTRREREERKSQATVRSWILVALVALLSCGAAPGTALESATDLVIVNGRIYTLDPAQPWAQAMAVHDGRIVAMGDNGEAIASVSASARRIDAGGRLVLPGMQDAHVHPLEAGSPVAGSCILAPDRPAERYIPRLRNCAAAQPTLGWMVGWGHTIEPLLEVTRPPVEILDEAVSDRPVAILARSSHSVWANSAALAAAGIDRETPDPAGGVILHDTDGRPNGLLLDNAGDLVLEVALAPNAAIDASNYKGLLQSLRRLNRNGITSLADARVYWTRNHLEIWRRAERKDTLSVRAVLGLWAYPQFDDDWQIEQLIALRDDVPGAMLRVSQVKLYADGIVVNSTAALLKPYRTHLQLGTDVGLNYFDPARLTRYVTELERAGFDLHIHAIGDRGVHEALNAIEAARQVNGDLGRRHQITHLEYVERQDWARFAALGVFANFQTSSEFVEPRHKFDEAYRLGRQRIRKEFLRLRSILDAGATIVLSSDWDVGSPSPFVGMQRALTRGKQSLPDVETAIRAYTLNPALLLDHLDDTGSIEVGKLADVIIIDRDLFQIPVNEIGATRVLLTLLGGKEVFRSAEFSG